jgi:hypothetical protein
MSQRASPRSRTLLSGRIILSEGKSVIDCTVRDLSAEGARIRVDEVAIVPAQFYIEIGEDRRRELCRVVWRRPTEVGVAFVR